MANLNEPVVMGYPAPPGFFLPPPAPLRPHLPANPSPQAQPAEDAQVWNKASACWTGLIYSLICLVFVLGILCIGLIVRTYIDGHSSPKFKISSLSVSPFNSSSSSSFSTLKPNWNITFFVRNPNIFNEISYERLQVSVSHNGVPVASGFVSPFHLNAIFKFGKGKDKRFVEANNMEALSSLAADSGLVSRIDGDFQDGAVNFTVAIDGTVLVQDRTGEGCRRHRIKVSCGDVMVGPSGNGTAGALVGESTKCKAHIDFDQYEHINSCNII